MLADWPGPVSTQPAVFYELSFRSWTFGAKAQRINNKHLITISFDVSEQGVSLWLCVNICICGSTTELESVGWLNNVYCKQKYFTHVHWWGYYSFIFGLTSSVEKQLHMTADASSHLTSVVRTCFCASISRWRPPTSSHFFILVTKLQVHLDANLDGTRCGVMVVVGSWGDAAFFLLISDDDTPFPWVWQLLAACRG